MSSTPSSTSSEGVDAALHSQYRLRVTSGPSYDPSTHKIVSVNAPETLTFETEHIILSVAVRIKNFTGFPTTSPVTSSYFAHPLHERDQYSIAFSFIPKVDISGDDLIFGNDFDRPIRDRLPPGFNAAFKIVKWWIDPGLEGDPYADRPYMYGPALSSWNYVRVCDKIIAPAQTDQSDAWKMPNAESFHETIIEEGGEGTGVDVRQEKSIPDEAEARKKFFLTKTNRAAFTFEAGRLYQSDFGNPHLDFNDFSLKLPGFSLNVIKYIDSKTHELRYTLKNKSTGDIYAVVLFTLLFGDELRAVEQEASSDNTTGSNTADDDVD